MPRGIPNRKAAAEEPLAADAAPDGPIPEPVEAPAEEPSSAPAPDPAPAEPVAPVDESHPCPACFPDGWPAGATSVGCIHGQWDRSTAGD